ncbi:MAG: hypothetical protein LBB54_05800 [Cellulomonadaceae bacterium]|nr:hypothetical protein [Cellulomonadaceae bacterium]
MAFASFASPAYAAPASGLIPGDTVYAPATVLTTACATAGVNLTATFPASDQPFLNDGLATQVSTDGGTTWVTLKPDTVGPANIGISAPQNLVFDNVSDGANGALGTPDFTLTKNTPLTVIVRTVWPYSSGSVQGIDFIPPTIGFVSDCADANGVQAPQDQPPPQGMLEVADGSGSYADVYYTDPSQLPAIFANPSVGKAALSQLLAAGASTVDPGATINLTGAGMIPGATTTFTVTDSSGKTVAGPSTATADSNGAFTGSVTLPQDIPPGTYTILAADSNDQPVTTTITVADPSPPSTSPAPTVPPTPDPDEPTPTPTSTISLGGGQVAPTPAASAGPTQGPANPPAGPGQTASPAPSTGAATGTSNGQAASPPNGSAQSDSSDTPGVTIQSAAPASAAHRYAQPTQEPAGSLTGTGIIEPWPVVAAALLASAGGWLVINRHRRGDDTVVLQPVDK